MAVGFKNAGFPLGLGRPQVTVSVGFKSMFFWMGGVGGSSPIVPPNPDGTFRGRKKKIKGLASPPPMLVPELPNDDDEVLTQVLDLFMKGLQ